MTDSRFTQIQTALSTLHKRYLALFQETEAQLPCVPYDPEWLSPCLTGGRLAHNEVAWQPVIRTNLHDFSGMESALGWTFHEDSKAFYSAYWSDGICGRLQGTELKLIQVWNEEDLEMLKENLLGHCFAKQKNRQPRSLFIGCSIDDDIIAIDNDSGAVTLEQPGFAPSQILADDLVQFLDEFEPNTRPYAD